MTPQDSLLRERICHGTHDLATTIHIDGHIRRILIFVKLQLTLLHILF
jgi:hypothetical protein